MYKVPDSLQFSTIEYDVNKDILNHTEHDVSLLRVFFSQDAGRADIRCLSSATEREKYHVESVKNSVRTSSDVGFFIIQNATLHGSGYIYKDGRLLDNPGVMAPYVLGLARAGHRPDIATTVGLRKRYISEPAIIAVAEAPLIYGHWLVDYFPRLWLCKKYIRDFSQRFKVLLPIITPQWAIEILQRYLGIDNQNIILYDSFTEELHLEQVVIPTFLHKAHDFHPLMNEFSESCAAMSESCAAMAESAYAPDSIPQKIYLSRRNLSNTHSRPRNLKNEDELIHTAEKSGYSIVFPEEMPWPAQIKLFRNATHIIGEEGSAMHNSLFSRIGSKTATIGLESNVQASISALRKQPLYVLEVDSSMDAHGTKLNHLPIERFKQLLSEIE